MEGFYEEKKKKKKKKGYRFVRDLSFGLSILVRNRKKGTKMKSFDWSIPFPTRSHKNGEIWEERALLSYLSHSHHPNEFIFACEEETPRNWGSDEKLTQKVMKEARKFTMLSKLVM